MQIVFAHYHLNPGGVTQVVLSQIRALATLPESSRPRRIGVLYGGRDAGWPESMWADEAPFEVLLLPVPELDYDDAEVPASESLARKVLQELTSQGFTPGDTVLHIHNHALGKNVSWPGAVRMLADEGYRLLLQIHDFAEDFRPANYRRLATAFAADDPGGLGEQLYPQSPTIHYATLTPRDADVLRQAGCAEDRLHVLPNPAAEFAQLPTYEAVARPVRSQLGIPGDARLVLYPVRGIRRKNLGELLLYSAISPPGTWHAVTLAPRNPVELPSFERWKTLAEELGLRTLFDICGDGEPAFLDALAASDRVITTSVAEGFGMVFLETWLAGKRLVGRDLPGITVDFESAGLRFPGLRRTFDVPLAWFPDRGRMADAFDQAYTWACEQYGVRPDSTEREHARHLAGDDRRTIDFALLPGEFQEVAIRHAAADPAAARTQLAGLNAGLAEVFSDNPSGQTRIDANAAIVKSTYSLPRIGRQLDEIYQGVAESTAGDMRPLAAGDAILAYFLKADRLHAIRFEE